jgi:nucleoside-diphosphate-sugar epimerase
VTRALLIGGTGFIGRATAQALRAEGSFVAIASRAPADVASVADLHLCADRRDPGEIARLIQAHRIDRVIDVVAYARAETATLAAALDGRIARYVLLSSSDVYRQYGLLHRLEHDTPAPGLLDEQAPLRTHRFPYRQHPPRADGDPQRWMDDYEKIDVEEVVRAMRSDWTILRLPMVFGPGDKQRRFRWALGPMQEGAATLEVPAAWAAWTTTYGYVGNVAAAIAAAALHERGANQVFNVVDLTPQAHRWWIERLAAIAGWRGDVQETNDPAHPFAQRLAALDLSAPLALSGARLRDTLRWTPPISLEDALSATIVDEAAR